MADGAIAKKEAPRATALMVAQVLLATQERILSDLWGEQFERTGLLPAVREAIEFARRAGICVSPPEEEEPPPEKGVKWKKVRWAGGWRWERT